jgi:S-adenosylmethionine:tRNA ribosyltransferase-isomerase
MNAITQSIVQFDLPSHLACPIPTEDRHMERDEVRLLVTTNSGEIEHTKFNNLPAFLQRGDVLVVNTSATIPAALPVTLPGSKQGRLHLSTKLSDKKWLVEIREITGNKTRRWHDGTQGMTFHLPSASAVTLKQRFYSNERWLNLWVAEFNLHEPMQKYLASNASPIQYEKLDRNYPLSYYQTFFSFHPGSSEMPSAGRGFTSRLVENLVKKGITFAPIVLHTGVSSLEENETPYPEYMEIDPVSSAIINNAKNQGRRIIAVGTTCIRAIETAANNREGHVIPFRGNTELFVDENYDMKIIDGLLTGFHEPKASHLNMLQAIAGFDHIDKAYKQAVQAGYFWHQFGDLHLILP